MIVKKLRECFWPFGQIGEQSIKDQPEHLHEAIRMKNRWKSHPYLPFVLRWAVLTAVIGISLGIVGSFDKSIWNYILWMILWAAFVSGAAITAFLFWIYSQRPK